MDKKTIASMIDHTLLKPDATSDKIAQLCFEARKYHFASVCVNPTHVKLCADLLRGSDVKVCTVIGFPLGATSAEVKAFETRNALDNGATEIDMVLNIGALKAGETELVARDIRGVVETGHAAAPRRSKYRFVSSSVQCRRSESSRRAVLIFLCCGSRRAMLFISSVA